MVSVKHRRANKDYPEIGIKAGEMYYTWRMRQGNGSVKRMSKTPPKPSQLTLSDWASPYRAFAEEIEELELDDNLYSELQRIAGEIRSLGEEQQAKLDNMPEGLQQGDTGQLLQSRAEACEEWADAIEALDEPDIPNEDEVRNGVERDADASDEGYKEDQDAAWSDAEASYQGELESLRDDAVAAQPEEP